MVAHHLEQIDNVEVLVKLIDALLQKYVLLRIFQVSKAFAIATVVAAEEVPKREESAVAEPSLI